MWRAQTRLGWVWWCVRLGVTSAKGKSVGKKFSIFVTFLAVLALAVGTSWWWPAPLSGVAHRLFASPAELSNPTQLLDSLWADIPTYALPTTMSSSIAFLPGLPALGKDSMAAAIRPDLTDDMLFHQEEVRSGAIAQRPWSFEMSSAAASLSGTIWDAVFVQLSSSGNCGSGGCTVDVLHRTDAGWTTVGSLFGCFEIELLTTRSHGLKDIRYADCPSKSIYIFRFNGRAYVDD